MARRIKKAQIKFISLVPAGANKLQAVYKADGQFEVGSVSKMDEQGELTAVVYPVGHRDSQGDIAEASVVKQMAYDFISNGASIDIRHDGKPVSPDRARVAESFLVQKGDERFKDWKDTEGTSLDLTGAWACVIKIDDEKLREKFRSGEWAGVSMGGTAIVEQEKADLDRLVDALSKALNPQPAQPNPTQDEDPMDAKQFEDLQKSFTEGLKALGENLIKSLKPEEKKPDDEPKDKIEKTAPKFKGKLSDKFAVRKHSLETQLFNLEKDLDWNDEQSVEEFLEKSEEISEEIAELEKEITEAKGKSKAGSADRSSRVAKGGDQAVTVGLAKEDSDALRVGFDLADAINKDNGFQEK